MLAVARAVMLRTRQAPVAVLADAVVGFEFLTSVAVLVFALLAEGFKRPSLFEFPVLLAMLLLGSGLVFVRALERWL